MKNVTLLSVAALLAFSGCKEKAPFISFNDVKSVDTTYVVAPIPSAEPHNVLFEDFTGATCSNCPGAKENYLDPIIAANPNRINVVALHVTDFVQTRPVKGAKYDFRDSTATLIEQAIYSALYAMPVAGVDRMPFGSATTGSVYQIQKAEWSLHANTRLAVADSMNLSVTSTFDTTTRMATIKTKVTYLYPTSMVHNISVVLVEDSLVDFQEDGIETDSFYRFDDVFRGMVTTAPYGDEILPAKTLGANYPAKEPGRVYERTYSYYVKPTLVAKNCRIIAFINKSGTNGGAMVYQSKQTKLMQ